MFKSIPARLPIVCVLILLGMLLASPTVAQAGEQPNYRPYLTFNLASRHIGTEFKFNERNPGIGFGIAFAFANGAELSPEFGLYKNSFHKRSVYAAVTYDMPVADLSPKTQLRLGGFAGLVHYPGDTQKFRDGGAIMVGDAVMLAGISATLRQNDRVDYRVRIMPGGSAAKVLMTLQMGIRF